MTRRVPRRRVAHYKPYRVNNSPRGINRASRERFKWIDLDLLWTRDGVAVNTHWPKLWRDGFLPKGHSGTVGSLSWLEIEGLRSPDGYRIQTMREALQITAGYGLNVEVEVKDRDAFHLDLYTDLAAAAAAAYGPSWREHVWVKTLTSIGGYRAAVTRLQYASAAGFTTLLLLRDRSVWRRRFSHHVDYVRGARRHPRKRI